MPTFNDFVQTELPKRPYSEADGAAGQIPVRSANGVAARQLEWIDPKDLSFPDAADATPEAIAVKQGGVWTTLSWAAFIAMIGTTPPSIDANQVTVNGDGVTINGEACLVSGGSANVTIDGVPLTINAVQVVIT